MADQNFQYGSQEVFSLRKEGKSEEALKLAREIYGGNSVDAWNVRALAWCLYDEVKRLKAESDEKTLGMVREELSALKLPEGDKDQMLHDCVAMALGSAPADKATELSKAGKHHEAVELLRPVAKATEATQHDVEAYGWVLYRKIKDCGNEETDVPVWCLNEFLNYWSSEREPNAILFKCLLIQARIHAENWAGVVPLIEKFELHRMSPDDFADENPDSDYDSFQDQMLGAVHKCLKKHPAMREGRPGLHQWMEAWKDSFGDGEWPEYHLGHILVWIGGDRDRARGLLLKTVQRNPNDYWRWQAFSDVLTGEERKAALARGVLCHSEEPSYKVPIYRTYSEVLAEEGELLQAKASLDEAIRLKRLSGSEWRDPMPAWYEQATGDEEVDMQGYAKEFAGKADELLAGELKPALCVLMRRLKRENCFLYYCDSLGVRTLKFAHDNLPPDDCEAIEAKFHDQPEGICKVFGWSAAQVPEELGKWIDGAVSNVNLEKGLVAVVTLKSDFTPLFLDRWSNAVDLHCGDCLKLQVHTDQEGKELILSWRRRERGAISGTLIAVEGTFHAVHDKPFGFVDDSVERVFVAPPEAGKLRDSDEVKGWAIRAKDKQGRTTWKLLPDAT